MEKIKELFKKKEFLKYFLMFFSGTILAQSITIGLSPVLTRIYNPHDFGVYGVYLSIVSILIVFITGRYEFAINATKNEVDALSLYRLVNYLSIFLSLIIFIFLLFVSDLILDFLRISIRNHILLLVPLTLLLMGLLQSSTYFLNRHKDFPILSKSKVYQSIGNGTAALLLGLMKFGAIGLVIGNIISLFVSQFYQRYKGVRNRTIPVSSKLIKENMKKYKQYPLFNAPSAFFDSVALQAPILIFNRFFTETIVGFYSLTTRVIGLPLTLISTSISQVFLSQIAELHRNNESYRNLIIKIAMYLAIIGLLPTLIFYLWAPSIFSFVFGTEWMTAGKYTQILVFGFFLKFIVSPLSMVFFINQKVKLLSYIQTTRAVSTVLVTLLFSINFNLETVLYAYTIHEIVFYIIYFYFILKTSD